MLTPSGEGRLRSPDSSWDDLVREYASAVREDFLVHSFIFWECGKKRGVQVFVMQSDNHVPIENCVGLVYCRLFEDFFGEDIPSFSGWHVQRVCI